MLGGPDEWSGGRDGGDWATDPGEHWGPAPHAPGSGTVRCFCLAPLGASVSCEGQHGYSHQPALAPASFWVPRFWVNPNTPQATRLGSGGRGEGGALQGAELGGRERGELVSSRPSTHGNQARGQERGSRWYPPAEKGIHPPLGYLGFLTLNDTVCVLARTNICPCFLGLTDICPSLGVHQSRASPHTHEIMSLGESAHGTENLPFRANVIISVEWKSVVCMHSHVDIFSYPQGWV